MNMNKIKLHKNHIPLNPNLVLENQEHYDFHINTLLFLYKQVHKGFHPNFFITFHYRHPSERYVARKETKNNLGWKDRYGMDTDKTLWREIPNYNYYDRKRNDYDEVIKDTREIRNVIAKELYGVKRINHIDKMPNMLFLHELGKIKLQYHTHLLLPKLNSRNNQFNLCVNTADELEFLFNDSIKHKRKCFSCWKRIDVRPVSNSFKAVSYPNKETTRNHTSLDFQNSIFVN